MAKLDLSRARDETRILYEGLEKETKRNGEEKKKLWRDWLYGGDSLEKKKEAAVLASSATLYIESSAIGRLQSTLKEETEKKKAKKVRARWKSRESHRPQLWLQGHARFGRNRLWWRLRFVSRAFVVGLALDFMFFYPSVIFFFFFLLFCAP